MVWRRRSPQCVIRRWGAGRIERSDFHGKIGIDWSTWHRRDRWGRGCHGFHPMRAAEHLESCGLQRLGRRRVLHTSRDFPPPHLSVKRNRLVVRAAVTYTSSSERGTSTGLRNDTCRLVVLVLETKSNTHKYS